MRVSPSREPFARALVCARQPPRFSDSRYVLGPRSAFRVLVCGVPADPGWPLYSMASQEDDEFDVIMAQNIKSSRGRHGARGSPSVLPMELSTDMHEAHEPGGHVR